MQAGTSSTEREPFVEAARFVCALLGPAPLGVMVLESTGTCVAANATLSALARQIPDSQRFDGTRVDFGASDSNLAFLKAIRGEIGMVETDCPPVLGPGQGLWKLHFLPFVVSEEFGVAVLFEDMTESRLATDAYQAAEQRFRMLVDSAADGIVIYRAHILLYVNPEAVRLLGFASSDELVGRPLADLVDGEHRPNFELRLTDLENDAGSGLFETVFVQRDGSPFPVECRTSHARVDELGAGFLFFRNIAVRKRMQLRRENARRIDALARLAKSLGSELHEYASQLRRLSTSKSPTDPDRSPQPSELQALAATMESRADALTLLPEPDPGRSSATRLEEVLAHVCSRLTPTSSAAAYGQNLHSNASTSPSLLVDLEPAPFAVRGDSGAIETGLIVLALAAQRSRTGSSSMSIRGWRNTDEPHGNSMTYTLSIAGGKPRVSATNASTTLGTIPSAAMTFGSWEQGKDLELLGAFSLLHSQGCWVDVQHSAGALSFEVELSLDPQRIVGEEPIDDMDPTARNPELPLDRHRVSHGYDMPPDTERSRDMNPQHEKRASSPILICDDESRLVTLTAGLLREFGFDVLTVRSGAEAIQAVIANPIDIVILDVNLPGEDAQEIVAEMRSRSNVSIILSSGYTEEDIEPGLLEDHAVKAFLAKPYGVEALVDTIDQVRLRGRQSPGASASRRI